MLTKRIIACLDVQAERVMGVQFHPEKSGATGLKILKNFLEIAS